MIVIDGSRGEGGGQILRSSLALSLVTGQPFRIERIRAGRSKPGLLRQHLTCVSAAAEVGHAEVDGAALGSLALVFRPGRVTAGDYRFAIGSAGSATLVLQTVVPALMTAGSPSTIRVEGGTHNPASPPFDHLQAAFLPLLGRMGPRVVATLERPGFYPAGGGAISVRVEPAPLTPIELMERGRLLDVTAEARVAGIPRGIADREVRALGAELGWSGDRLRAVELAREVGPGNVIVVTIASERVTEVFTGFGERGVPAEAVARAVAAEARQYLDAGVPVGPHLADQLVLPLALARGGQFRTTEPTPHTTTQVETIRAFMAVDVSMTEERGGVWLARMAG